MTVVTTLLSSVENICLRSLTDGAGSQLTLKLMLPLTPKVGGSSQPAALPSSAKSKQSGASPVLRRSRSLYS